MFSNEKDGANYSQSGLHNDDPYLANYCASLCTLYLSRFERQSLAQNALQALLKHTGKAFLIGEGTGGGMAWLATDAEPELVAGVIAIEPAGPPFGKATRGKENEHRVFTQFMEWAGNIRNYGLTDIPLTYDPPANLHDGLSSLGQAPLDIENRLRPDAKGSCYLQRGLWEDYVLPEGDTRDPHQVRELYNLKKVPQAIVTAHASSHVTYDWATVAFMVQAGVDLQWIKLDEHNIYGNGHLMFLETNSDDVARLLTECIYSMTLPEAFRGNILDHMTPPGARPVCESPEEAVQQSAASAPGVGLTDESAHHDDQPLVAKEEYIESPQLGYAEYLYHGGQPSGAYHAGLAQFEHAETQVASVQEHAETLHHNYQPLAAQAEYAASAQEDSEMPDHNYQPSAPQEDAIGSAQPEEAAHLHHAGQSPDSEDDRVDLVQFRYPESTQESPTDESYEPSSGSDPSTGSSGSHHDDQSSSPHSGDQPLNSRHGNHSSGSRRDNQSPGSRGNGGNLPQSEHTSDISYINSSPSQSDDEIVISQQAVTPQNQAQSSLGYSQGPASGHEQSAHKRLAPWSSGRQSLASEYGSSPPTGSWGQAQKRPRLAMSPAAPARTPSVYTPSVANATPGGSWQTEDTPRRGRERSESVDSPITSLATLRPACQAGPPHQRPRLSTTISSPIIVSPAPIGYTPRQEFLRSLNLTDDVPAQEQPHSAAGDGQRYSPRSQSTQGYYNQGRSTQGQTRQGYSTPGYRTQGYYNEGRSTQRPSVQDYSTHGRPAQGDSTQGYAAQGYSTQGYSTHGYHMQSQTTQGYRAQGNYSTQGRSTHRHTSHGPSAQGYTTQIYPHSAARFECQPGTAEESIAAMAMANQARLASNANSSTEATEDVRFSPFARPQMFPGSQMNQASGANNTREALQSTSLVSSSAAQPSPERPSTPEAPDSETENEWFGMVGSVPRMTPPSPSPAPRGSSNPASRNMSRGSSVRAGSRKRPASK